MSSTIKSIAKNYALFEIFILGVLSGMPFSILYTSIVVMMQEIGIDLAIVTSLALARLPYSLKFLWAPLIDGLEIPILNKFGRRKSWMMLITMINILLLTSITFTVSKDNFWIIKLLALAFGFMAASYDVAYDAWRIEKARRKITSLWRSISSLRLSYGSSNHCSWYALHCWNLG
jgi:PAT family beta-lactamase induction signal transducer AmpG